MKTAILVYLEASGGAVLAKYSMEEVPANA